MGVVKTTRAGSGRQLRLDPFALPVRFATADAAADEAVRHVELDRERVMLRRDVRGMRMAVDLPVATFLGVALRVAAPDQEHVGGVTVVLEHPDPNLSVPLFAATGGDEVVAIWRSWAQVLGLPPLVAEPDGTLREPFPRLGQVRAALPANRRRSAIYWRRPSILLRRKPGRPGCDLKVYRGEREIIARS
jgi:hypothetical protein